MKTNKNRLLMTDVYKLNHMLGYKPGITEVYAGMVARSFKKFDETLFYGLQPLIKVLEGAISQEEAEEFFSYYTQILGHAPAESIVTKINALVKLGYIPLEIKAVPEGTVLGNQNILVTVRNTLPEFYWCVGFFESMLLKVWNTCSVATTSLKYKRLVTKYVNETSDKDFLIPFMVHDFGYRGVSSEQTAELSGSAHLINFLGTDTVPAVKFLKENYAGEGLIGASVFATEHSIACSYGLTDEEEVDYAEQMLNLCPTGILSIVADAKDYFRFLTKTMEHPRIKPRILAREGKFVVRPDSGFPPHILLGDPNAPKGSNEYKGTFQILEENWGTTVNSKGYKDLNDKVGCIYGDAMFYERYESVLEGMKQRKLAATNLVIGVGGLLLQQHNRDDLGFAFKATHAVINGVATELYKDPITDPGKKSHKGLMMLVKDGNGKYHTVDQVSEADEKLGFLETVFKDGKVVKTHTLAEIRARSEGKL